MKHAIIITNAYSRLKTGLNQAERLKYELELLNVQTDIKRNGFFAVTQNDGNLKDALKGYDFCVYLDKDKYVSSALEKCGLRLFNRHSAIRVCDDKMETHLALAGKGVPMPKTVAGLLCYDQNATVTEESVDFIINELGLPVIVKESYGSLGKGVYKAENKKGLLALCEKLKLTPHIFQQFIEESAGKDVRVIVIGGKAVCAMMRKSDCDFRSNLELGGTAIPYEIDDRLRNICELTAKLLNLDYCGIDVLLSDNGYLVCEVNSNAFFGGIERVTGVNIARIYAEYMLKNIQ
ncbi:MAG: RimK family alpha-L-glutamate ligase [Clostridia bacterium]|nr:RimK family alpha-L-glutamate ligase [Clostridia bacterium]